jgi:hypothetical protein
MLEEHFIEGRCQAMRMHRAIFHTTSMECRGDGRNVDEIKCKSPITTARNFLRNINTNICVLMLMSLGETVCAAGKSKVISLCYPIASFVTFHIGLPLQFHLFNHITICVGL